MELKNYIDIAKELSEEGIPESVSVCIIQELGKDHRTQTMEIGKDKRVNTFKEPLKEREELATDKQVSFLKKIRLYKEGMTKREAFAIIKDFKENK
jgi:hypothetical protein